MTNLKNYLMRLFALTSMLLVVAGCAITPERKDGTFNRVNEELRQAAQTPAQKDAVPSNVSDALLPPLKIAVPKSSAKQLDQRFDLVISDAPAAQVFMGIVSGTRYSMLVNPEVKGNLSVNLKDVTVFEALDAIREMYGYEYKVDGSRIYINKPQLQTRVFQVNCVVGLRRGRSDISVTSGAAGNSNQGSSTFSSGTATTQLQASSLTSSQKGDFWSEVEDAIRVTLNCRIPQMTMTNAMGGVGGMGVGAGMGMGMGMGNRNMPQQETMYAPRDRGLEGCPEGRSVLVNQMSNTILVRAMPEEIRMVDQMLRTMQVNVEKQVILEAKIIDVILNEGSQQGINWAAFHNGEFRAGVGGGALATREASAATGTLGENLGTGLPGAAGSILGGGLVGATGTAFSAGLGIALNLNNFAALIDFLETQGEVQVLSSPRISTINNQKAVLKVGKDEQFVTGFDANANTTNTTGGTTVNQPTPVYSTFFSGISLDVTPQIDDDGRITLHVHPLVSDVTEV